MHVQYAVEPPTFIYTRKTTFGRWLPNRSANLVIIGFIFGFPAQTAGCSDLIKRLPMDGRTDCGSSSLPEANASD